MGLSSSVEDIALCEIYIKASFLDLNNVTCLKQMFMVTASIFTMFYGC